MRGLSFGTPLGLRSAPFGLRPRAHARRCEVTREAQCGRQGGLTPHQPHGVSVYYPFALVELVDIGKTDEHAETGEVLLCFLDEDRCQVTLRLSPKALEQLRARLAGTAPP